MGRDDVRDEPVAPELCGLFGGRPHPGRVKWKLHGMCTMKFGGGLPAFLRAIARQYGVENVLQRTQGCNSRTQRCRQDTPCPRWGSET